MPRALILSYHFYPSREVGAKRISELACRLRDGGWQVTAIAAPANPLPELSERIRGMEVITVRPPEKIYPRLARHFKRKQAAGTAPTHGAFVGGSGEESKRSWRYTFWRHCNAIEWLLDDRKLWSTLVLMQALRRRTHWDWIISSGPPVSIHVAARLLAGITGSRWLMDLRDPWVGNGFWPAYVRSALRDALESRLEATCARRADSITVTAPGIARALAVRFPWAAPKLQVVLNGYDGSAAAAAPASGKLRLLYAGTLYFNRDPFPLLEALGELVTTPGVDRTRVEFTLVGDCGEWNGRSLGQWIEAQGLGDCVRILRPVSPAAVREMMCRSEVLVNFAQGQPDQIPAKLYDYIASGREMLLIAEQYSDVARVTRESGCGRIVEPQDRPGLAAVLRDLYSFYVERGQAFTPVGAVIENYSRVRQNSRFLDLMAAGG